MTTSRKHDRRLRGHILPLAGLAVGCFLLGGCAGPFAELPVMGLPSNTPARPDVQPDYPAVHDIPAARSRAVLDPEEQAKIEKDLLAARNRQTGSASKASQRKN